jgi:alpha-tubulin suppressor-like RCC1 family protein
MVDPDGGVKTWGSASGISIGDGLTGGARVDAPKSLPGIRTAVSAAVGDSHALILLSDGTVLAWGRNSDGSSPGV